MQKETIDEYIIRKDKWSICKKHFFKKFGRTCEFSARKCNKRTCTDLQYDDCLERVSALNIASSRAAAEWHKRGWNKIWRRKQAGTFRPLQMIRCWKWEHIRLSSFCLRCKIKEEELCSIENNKGIIRNSKCIHPL